jgi:hypothetical protein
VTLPFPELERSELTINIVWLRNRSPKHEKMLRRPPRWTSPENLEPRSPSTRRTKGLRKDLDLFPSARIMSHLRDHIYSSRNRKSPRSRTLTPKRQYWVQTTLHFKTPRRSTVWIKWPGTTSDAEWRYSVCGKYVLPTLEPGISDGSEREIWITGLVDSSPTCRHSAFQLRKRTVHDFAAVVGSLKDLRVL